MYKITLLCPDHELQIPDEQDALSDFEVKSATTMIITAQEDDDVIKLITGLCGVIASGEATSLTVTKEDDTDK